jgi:ankyrin repeat protein
LNLFKVTNSNHTDSNNDEHKNRSITQDAVVYGHLHILKRLPLVDNDNDIYTGICYHQNRTVEYLLQSFDTEVYNKIVSNIVTSIAHYGNFALIESIHSKQQNINFDDALIQAISIRCFKIVKYLVKHGANVNYEDDDCSHPFTVAVESGNLSIVKYLVSKGTILDNLNHKTVLCAIFGPDMNHRIVSCATSGPDMMQMFEYLIGLGFTPDDDVLEHAIRSDNIEAVQLLVKYGLSLDNYYIDSRFTLLETPDACDMFRYLLKHAKYTVSSLTEILRTNLSQGYLTIPILQLLLSHGAELPDYVEFRSRKYNPHLLKIIISMKPSLASGLSKKQWIALDL